MNRDPEYYLEKADYFYQRAETATPDDIKQIPKCVIKRKIINGRYFDPITKHYYKLEQPETKKIPKNKDGVWFPENKPKHEIITDPETGESYYIKKIYNDNGEYFYEKQKIHCQLHKLPGSNYYKPFYTINSSEY